MRARRQVPSWVLIVLWPAYRYSYSRDAHILRLIGRWVGPVLRERKENIDGR
jgi:hypothetical protein